MKRKFLLPILSICMVVALVSVGFAAWLITGNDTTGADGQFVTYDVSNQYFAITANVSNSITFGKPTDSALQENTPTYDWFQFKDEDNSQMAVQNLSTTVTLTLTPEDKTYLTNVLGGGYKLKVTLQSGSGTQENFSANSDYDDAVEAGYLSLPTLESGSWSEDANTSLKDGLSFTIDITSTTFQTNTQQDAATYTFTLNFDWGNFGDSTNQNPYFYFNNLASTPENRTKATNAMKAINELANYAISLEIVSSSNSAE